MANIIIRNIEEFVKKRLRIQAAMHGHSMEEEARDVLRNALARSTAKSMSLADAIRKPLESIGFVDLPPIERPPPREPPDFNSSDFDE